MEEDQRHPQFSCDGDDVSDGAGHESCGVEEEE